MRVQFILSATPFFSGVIGTLNWRWIPSNLRKFPIFTFVYSPPLSERRTFSFWPVHCLLESSTPGTSQKPGCSVSGHTTRCSMPCRQWTSGSILLLQVTGYSSFPHISVHQTKWLLVGHQWLGNDFEDAFHLCTIHRNWHPLTHHSQNCPSVCPSPTSLSFALPDSQNVDAKHSPSSPDFGSQLHWAADNHCDSPGSTDSNSCCHRNKLLPSVQNFTTALIKHGHLSSFCCFGHTDQVVGQHWHKECMLYPATHSFAVQKVHLQRNDSTSSHL